MVSSGGWRPLDDICLCAVVRSQKCAGCGVLHSNPALVGRKCGASNLPDADTCTICMAGAETGEADSVRRTVRLLCRADAAGVLLPLRPECGGAGRFMADSVLPVAIRGFFALTQARRNRSVCRIAGFVAVAAVIAADPQLSVAAFAGAGRYQSGRC